MSENNASERAGSVLERYGDMLLRICLVNLGTRADAEDALSDTLIRYLTRAPKFASDEHEKAWLIRVALNRCRDIQRAHTRHPTVGLEDISPADTRTPDTDCGEGDIIAALGRLPEKYRTVMTLYYVEEMSIRDISGVIKRTESAVKMRLKKGRELLRTEYEKELRK